MFQGRARRPVTFDRIVGGVRGARIARDAPAHSPRAPCFPGSTPVVDAPATEDFVLSSADLSWSLLRTARTREAAEPRRGLTSLAWTRTTAGAMAVRAPSDSMVTYHAVSRWNVPRDHRHASADLSHEVFFILDGMA